MQQKRWKDSAAPSIQKVPARPKAEILGSLIWSRDIICLHILLHRKHFLCSKICKQIMALDQMRDPLIKTYFIPLLPASQKFQGVLG